jgi:hypothetical protein
MDLTVRALAQSSQEQLKLSQQLALLVASQHKEEPPDARRGGGRTQEGSVPVQNRGGGCTRAEDEVSFSRSTLPKLSFPKFNGDNPHIWIDKCHDYFQIFNIPECLWVTAASLHMEENAGKWLQVYKLCSGLGSWLDFVTTVEDKFGAYDYRQAIQDLL